jgi:hypothetical protein
MKPSERINQSLSMGYGGTKETGIILDELWLAVFPSDGTALAGHAASGELAHTASGLSVRERISARDKKLEALGYEKPEYDSAGMPYSVWEPDAGRSVSGLAMAEDGDALAMLQSFQLADRMPPGKLLEICRAIEAERAQYRAINGQAHDYLTTEQRAHEETKELLRIARNEPTVQALTEKYEAIIEAEQCAHGKMRRERDQERTECRVAQERAVALQSRIEAAAQVLREARYHHRSALLAGDALEALGFDRDGNEVGK